MARLLSPPRTVWLTEPVPDGDQLTAWLRDVEASEHPITAVLGYCIGAVFVPHVAEAVADRLGTTPKAIVFEPEPATKAGLVADFGRALRQFSGVLPDARLAAYLDSANRLQTQAADLPELGSGLLDVFRAAATASFEKAGVSAELVGGLTEEMVGRFAAFVSYTDAAHRTDPEPDFATTTVIRSSIPARWPTPRAREVRFEVDRPEILRDRGVAEAVSALLG